MIRAIGRVMDTHPFAALWCAVFALGVAETPFMVWIVTQDMVQRLTR